MKKALIVKITSQGRSLVPQLLLNNSYEAHIINQGVSKVNTITFITKKDFL